MKDRFIGRALRVPNTALTFEVTRRLSRRGRVVLETEQKLDVLGFAAAGHARAALAPGVNEIVTNWLGPGDGLGDQPVNAWMHVEHEGHDLEVLRLTWPERYDMTSRTWIIATNEAAARAFLAACGAWSGEVHGEILVFSDGCFSKNARLHRDVRGATWSDLVLEGALKDDIRNDFDQFFASRAAYASYRAPWRRGAMLIGPPGNGKTHCVKALVHHLSKPTIYVRGIRHRYMTTASCISALFDRARQISPCLMVLEDVDGLFDPEGLAFFLNELDGFADNEGIVTLATTNHPERLDPALLDRPSRFDRTYAFAMPALGERRRFLELQNDRLVAPHQLSAAAIDELADKTHDFSFAYLKELVVGALLAAAGADALDFDSAARAGLVRLREQMGRARQVVQAPKKAGALLPLE